MHNSRLLSTGQDLIPPYPNSFRTSSVKLQNKVQIVRNVRCTISRTICKDPNHSPMDDWVNTWTGQKVYMKKGWIHGTWYTTLPIYLFWGKITNFVCLLVLHKEQNSILSVFPWLCHTFVCLLMFLFKTLFKALKG